MHELIISPYLLAGLLFFVALAYSALGMGGASSYTALMAIFGMSYLYIPPVSLSLNMAVTSVAAFNFIRKGHLRFDLLLPFLVASIPMAYLGGALQISQTVFLWVLLISLLFVVARIYLLDSTALKLQLTPTSKIIISLFAGAILGFVAGIVGIGGGVYLVPLIIVLGLGSPREAAACGAVFVWLNSFTGLISRFQNQPVELTADMFPLLIAVIAGAVLGSHHGSAKLKPAVMEKWLGGIILVAIVLLIKRIISS